eukprot:869373-Pelagomonas_calceolata.AAC.1
MHGGDVLCQNLCSRPQPYKSAACAHLALENVCYPSRNVCWPDISHSLLTAGRRNGQPVAEVDPEHFAKSSWREIHNTVDGDHLGAFYENMALNLFSSIGFVPLCASTTRFLSATVSFSKKFSMLTLALAP